MKDNETFLSLGRADYIPGRLGDANNKARAILQIIGEAKPMMSAIPGMKPGFASRTFFTRSAARIHHLP